MEAIRNAIKFAPNKPSSYKQAAIIFDACERDSEAGQYALKAIDLGKQDSVTLTLAGKSLLVAGKAPEGLRYLADAVKANPNNLHARFYYAQALKATGDIEYGETESGRDIVEQIGDALERPGAAGDAVIGGLTG